MDIMKILIETYLKQQGIEADVKMKEKENGKNENRSNYKNG